MKRATFIYTRPAPFDSTKVDTPYTFTVEEEDDSLFYARVTGVLKGLVGWGALDGNSIVGFQVEEV